MMLGAMTVSRLSPELAYGAGREKAAGSETIDPLLVTLGIRVIAPGARRIRLVPLISAL